MVHRPLVTLTVLALAAALALALAIPGGAAPAPRAHAAKARSCGAFAAPGGAPAEYRIKVAKGVVKCKNARKILHRFITTGKRSKGWDCRNGASGLTVWAEACGSPYHSLQDTFHDRNFKKVIKAYYVLDE